MAPDPSLRSRLRDALRQSAVRAVPVPAASRTGGDDTSETDEGGLRELRYEAEGEPQQRTDSGQEAWIAGVLGGWWRRDDSGVCLVVDRRFAAGQPHGDARLGDYGEALALHGSGLTRLGPRSNALDPLSLFSDLDAEVGPASGSGVRTADSGFETRFLFFDLETTGLSGGAGICAFLIGFGWFEEGTFRTRQYFLSGYGHEAALLRMAAAAVAGVTLVTFNGRAFDVPLIDGRYLFHRIPSPFDGVPHVDLLHPARRLWRHRPPGQLSMDPDRRDAFARYFRMTRSTGAESRSAGPRRANGLSANAASCALGALEEAVLGFRRTDDVPGADIPSRFFHYVRSGDVRPLEPVLEHNRLDLVSLAALSGIVARMLEEGAAAARNAHECLALGSLFERAGSSERAAACYERAVESHAGAAWQTDPLVEREALRRLALRRRRERQYDEAAAAWQRLLDLPSPWAGGRLDFEAVHALAVHHEHRSRNLQAAHELVVRALSITDDVRLHESLRHRLARIERKLGISRTAAT